MAMKTQLTHKDIMALDIPPLKGRLMEPPRYYKRMGTGFCLVQIHVPSFVTTSYPDTFVVDAPNVHMAKSYLMEYYRKTSITTNEMVVLHREDIIEAWHRLGHHPRCISC